MSVLIRPLRLDGFEQLPKHARRCVFWEVDPRTLAGEHLPDPEFEKEAWLSMVMLEWGSCGQIATSAPRDDSRDAEEPCLGYVLYAPPRAVPRAQQFPTGPVSADAVLLTVEKFESRLTHVSRAQEKIATLMPDAFGVVFLGASRDECLQ